MDCLIVHCGLLAGSCTNGEINHLVGSHCTGGTLPSYKKSYSPYQQSDGSYTFVRNNSMGLSGVLSVDQNIWLTGGKLSLTSSLNAKAAVTTANSNLNAKMFQLRAFLDSSEEVTLQPVLPESVPDLSINYDRLLQKALERNAFAQNIRRRQLEADYEVATAKGNLRSVDLFASVGYSGLDHTLSSAYKVLKDNSVVEVGVKIPILDWGKVKVAQSNREVISSRIKQEQINFNQDIFLLVEHFNNQAQQLSIAHEADAIAQQRYKTSIETFLIGKINTLDLNDAQAAKDEARQKRISELYYYWYYYYQIRSVTLWDFRSNTELTADFDDVIRKQ